MTRGVIVMVIAFAAFWVLPSLLIAFLPLFGSRMFAENAKGEMI